MNGSLGARRYQLGRGGDREPTPSLQLTTPPLPPILPGTMKRRPLKAAEPAAAYVADQPATKPAAAQPAIRYVRTEDVRKANERLMKSHGDVLRRLAQ